MDIYAHHSNPVLYDEQMLSDKFGSDFERSCSRVVQTDDKIRAALLENELSELRKQLASKEQTQVVNSKRDGFTGGGCGCSSEGMRNNRKYYQSDDDDDDIYNLYGNKKLLLILVFILAAVCVMQYFNSKNESREMFEMLCSLLKQQQSSATAKPA